MEHMKERGREKERRWEEEGEGEGARTQNIHIQGEFQIFYHQFGRHS